MSTLESKNIIITGAGSGIGAAAASLAASRGARVACVDLDLEAATRTASAIVAAGGSAVARRADVSSEADVSALFEGLVAEWGTIHGIVNNAGMLVAKSVVDTSVEEWDRTMAVNARGVFLGCKYAVAHFLEAGIGGSIVNTGSISGLVGLREQAAYCASKGAVVQLTKQIAVDFSHAGIRCNSVGPGSVMTPVLEAYLDGQSDPGSARALLEGAHPIGRLAQPEEIAAAMCFLLSDDASFITGANLQADGGYTAQ
jgi:NAD(P)-dependent dehydrogenase (short-subunit alcohol dehydrogenase family)